MFLNLNPSNAEATFVQSAKTFENHLKHLMLVFIAWIALAEYSQMSTHMPGFQVFFRFLHHFVLAKEVTSSIRVNIFYPNRHLPFYESKKNLPSTCKWDDIVIFSVII